MVKKNYLVPTQSARRYTYLDVGRNKAIQARSARWRFRRIWVAFAGNAGSRYRSNQLIPAYIQSVAWNRSYVIYL